MITEADHAHFELFGFAVLRNFLDGAALSAEFDRTMRRAFPTIRPDHCGSTGNRFRYVPMMCARTPVSLHVVGQLAGVATELLGAPVLPGRAKGTEYHGETGWHRDSDLVVASAGFAAYLEPLAASSGALRLLPGSHHADYGAPSPRRRRSAIAATVRRTWPSRQRPAT